MEKLPSLNGLRAVSILMVILYHLLHLSFGIKEESLIQIPILNGRLGVNVFFVISGFLITSLLLEEEKRKGAISLKNFYIRRTLRIFPAYYFLLFVYWVLQLSGYLHIPGVAWLTALTYTKYLPYSPEYYTQHAWSLSIEENFYLFWPLLFMMGDRVRKIIAVFLILIPPFVRLYFNYYPLQWLYETSILVRIDAIAMGCFVALYRTEILAKLSSRWNDVFFYCMLLLFLVPWLEKLVESNFLDLFFVFFGVLTGTIANVLIAGILLYSVYGPQRRWYKVMNYSLLNYIGILSYSLYLWQQFFVFRTDWWVTQFPQNIGFIFLAALFSHYIIEKPFLRLKSKFAAKRMQTAIIG